MAQDQGRRQVKLQICINLRNNLWKKWGGDVNSRPPRGDAPAQDNQKLRKFRLHLFFFFIFCFALMLTTSTG